MVKNIGRYEIIEELGRGGMATVYLALDPRFNRKVALKILPREFMDDPNFRSRFEREARTIAVLEHPAIVPIYDFGDVEGQPYFVMRLMNGGSLAEKIAQGQFSLEEAYRIISRISSGLDEAHSKGVVHRDLKPGNILFDHRNEPYLADFGLAKKVEVGGKLTGSAVLGTPAYMSPEQGQGERDIDGRSDIYSLTVILFEMLTGRLPFESDNPFGQVIMHVTAPIPDILTYRPDLPPGFEKVIAKGMAKLRFTRFETARDLSQAINAHVEAHKDFIRSSAPQSTSESSSDPSEARTVPVTKTDAPGQDGNPRKWFTPQPKKDSSESRRPTPPGMTKNLNITTKRPSPIPQKTISARHVTPPTGNSRLENRRLSPLPVPTEDQVNRAKAVPLQKASRKILITAAVLVILLLIVAGGLVILKYPSIFSLVIANQVNTHTYTPSSTYEALTVTPTILEPKAFESTSTLWVTVTKTLTPNPTSTESIQITDTPMPTQLPVIGGADMIAFLHAGDIYTANVDGSELRQLTQDGGNKTGINWSPDGENILYINGLCVYSLSIDSLAVTKILCSNWATYLSNFEISPDGSYVAMTSSDGLYILPYDIPFLSQIRWPDQLKGERTCQFYSEGKIRTVRWSDTSDRVAIITTGSNSGLLVELIRVLQVLPCGSTPERLVEFPSTLTDIGNYLQNPKIQTFGWDGEFIFYLNTAFLNDFGEIYRYNFLQPTRGEKILPFRNLCCFRDFTWSPDNEYVMFAFQDNQFAQITQLYIIPVNTIGSGITYNPINLPENLLNNPKEKPQAVFRPRP